MKGSYKVSVSNNKVKYEFSIKRNLTILRGDSATGKTTLIDMIRSWTRDGEKSGINLSCDVKCLTLDETSWRFQKILIKETEKSIFFLDEDTAQFSSKEFAQTIFESNNYFVIATREFLPNLPYSICEIYGIKNEPRSKYGNIKQIYNTFYPLYENINENIEQKSLNIKTECVIVEDSNSGFDFFSSVCNDLGIKCISAEGKTKIYNLIKSLDYNSIFVIADGAAFGAEIERVLSVKKIKNLALLLPESFEWLILKSDVIDNAENRKILSSPSDFIESSENASWEQFFTKLLISSSKDTYLKYTKRKLNEAYLQNHEKNEILKVVKDLMN